MIASSWALRQVRVEQRRERDDRVLDAPLVLDDVEGAEALRLRVPQVGEHRVVDPPRVLAVRDRVRPDDLGDLRQRVGGPQVDRVEQRPGDEERHLVEEPVVVVARRRGSGPPGTRTGRRPRWSGRSAGVRVVQVVAYVGRDRARRDDHVGEVAVPGRRVVEARLPRVHEHRQRAPAGPPAAVEVVVLGDEARVEPAEEGGRRLDVGRVPVHLEGGAGVDAAAG